ncbi:MAG: beta-galactosidase trimerization domain-containing protein [Bacteroidota bacterium]|nr:beta-galactosidase trimerization domain-containing protein [Bacteroidota bacterium]
MDRREFIKTTTVIGSATFIPAFPAFAGNSSPQTDGPWFDRSLRWAQLAFVENDPGRYDPDFWLAYFQKIHADGALLSAGGVVAFYPTEIPLHHRSDWLGNANPVGDMVNGCRKMNMSVVLRTDPHATRQDMYDAHPDYISVTVDGQKRRHWANPALWVTCAYGPYNFDFMTSVHKEIMQRFEPDGIFSNRWAGHGICYCEHCKENFRKASGLDLPQTAERLDPVYRKWENWRTSRLKELWLLWDGVIRKQEPFARFIPNGFPDKLETGKYADIFFADQQARSGVIPPWSNGMGAKELRAGLGMKPIINIFSVGVEEEYRWKDSVQNEAEIRIWVAEGVANGMRPCFVKFGAFVYDKRWMKAVAGLYQAYFRNEPYLRNTAPMARVGMVYSEQTNRNYGGKAWQDKIRDHSLGIYHSLVEDHMPFEMVNDRLLDAEHLKSFKLLILPNIAALSDAQCAQLKAFVNSGGSLVATFETSLYDEEGKPRPNFGLSDLFGVTYDGAVEGPMKNSYLKLDGDKADGPYRQVMEGLENAYRIINSVYRVKVRPDLDFPSPVTLIPSYPDLPMEDVYPRKETTGTRELYLRDNGKGRVAYIPGDLDRSFWQLMNTDHGRLLRNTIRWALNEMPIVVVQTPGIFDVAVWRQKNSMTVHFVNLTNPMMMKGPFRDLIPCRARVQIEVPADSRVTGVHLLMSGATPAFESNGRTITLDVPEILDHEIVALDLA